MFSLAFVQIKINFQLRIFEIKKPFCMKKNSGDTFTANFFNYIGYIYRLVFGITYAIFENAMNAFFSFVNVSALPSHTTTVKP